MKRAYITLAIAVCSAGAFAQVIITDGTSSFGWTSNANLTGAAVRTGAGGGSGAVFDANGVGNQAFQNWWWYRVNGVNTREFALSTQQSAPVVAGNNMVLSYREPEGFTSRLEYTINNMNNGTTLVTGTNFVKNEGNNSLSIDFFNYLDMDMAGTAGADSAFLVASNPGFRMRVNDPAAASTFEYRALDAMAYQVTGFSTLRGLLANTAINNLNNTGLPFGPGDFTGGVQWSFSLAPGQMIALQTSWEINPVPEPATMAALAVGLGWLARRRKK
jgi:hypothetical protein